MYQKADNYVELWGVDQTLWLQILFVYSLVLSVTSLTSIQQGWMLLLCAWISFRQKQSKTLPVTSHDSQTDIHAFKWLDYFYCKWCDIVFGVSFQGEEVRSSQHRPPDWPQHWGQLRAAGRYHWKPEKSWHHPAVFVSFMHKCHFKADINRNPTNFHSEVMQEW